MEVSEIPAPRLYEHLKEYSTINVHRRGPTTRALTDMTSYTQIQHGARFDYTWGRALPELRAVHIHTHIGYLPPETVTSGCFLNHSHYCNASLLKAPFRKGYLTDVCIDKGGTEHSSVRHHATHLHRRAASLTGVMATETSGSQLLVTAIIRVIILHPSYCHHIAYRGSSSNVQGGFTRYFRSSQK